MPDFTMLEHLRRPWSFDEPEVREWAALRIESLESKLGDSETIRRSLAADLNTQAETITRLESRLNSCELERDKYRAALIADRGDEAANRIRDEDRAFCLTHQTYFDSDLGCARCNVVENQRPLSVTEIEQDGDEILTHLSDGRCAVNKLREE